MANKLKKRKTQQPDPDKLKPEKEETVQVKHLVKDERTHKIAGAILLVLALFLFIAFTSYLFTWQRDQDKVIKGGINVLFDDDVKVDNLLGRLGAWISHLFIYNGFGLASFFICSFFFVLGANLLFAKKLFSIKRNLRYVVAGIFYFSVAFAFLTPANTFPWGGALGEMINNWMQRFLGFIGTAVVLGVAGLAYFIWRFNPVFSIPSKKKSKVDQEVPLDTIEGFGTTENTSVVETLPEKHGNMLKSEGGIIVIHPTDSGRKPQVEELKMVEKELIEPEPLKKVEEVQKTPQEQSSTNKTKPEISKSNGQLIELEIKPVHIEKEEVNEDGVVVEVLPPYEPTLDLRDYKYPSLDLLENHGTDKIVQDAAELEANKNQIINTLKNYDIAIQKISATVGPTVTLYEIVPAAGVRISRIKNLEDDIALSLAASWNKDHRSNSR